MLGEHDEVPLEIEDFGCETGFEEVVAAVEDFLRAAVLRPTAGAADRKGSPGRKGVGGDAPGVAAQREFPLGDGDAVVVTVHRHDTKHPVARWVGVSTFVVASSKINGAPTRSDAALLLSYLLVACDALDLPLPCFAPVGDVNRECYVGHCRHDRRLTRYQLEAYAQQVPSQVRFISGLADLLQLSVGLQSRIVTTGPQSGIVVRAARSFSMPLALHADRERWLDGLQGHNERSLEHGGGSYSLPFGTTGCPLRALLVTCRWGDLSEHEIVDTATRSDFDVLSPSRGIAEIDPVVRRCTAAASVALESEYGLSFVGSGRVADRADALLRHLRRLVEEHCSSAPTQLDAGPRLSPAAIKRAAAEVMAGDGTPPASRIGQRVTALWGTDSPPFKDPRTAYAPSSLLARFAHVVADFEHPDDALSCWLVVIEALRHRVSAFLQAPTAAARDELCAVIGVDVCGSAGAGPHLDTPLVAQKLQMLHYCLQALGPQVTTAGGWDDDDDLLLESCSEGSAAELHDGTQGLDGSGSGTFEPIAEGEERTGGPKPRRQAHLITHGEGMRVPPPRLQHPRTQDQLDAEQRALMTLGTGAAGQATRSWLQSRTLLEDMVYFRRAQVPGAAVTFVDFVRWHSPKDYIGPAFDAAGGVAECSDLREAAKALPLEELLSQRMASTDKANPWQQLWEDSATLPPLQEFHPDAEALAALDYLADGVTPEDVLFLCVACGTSGLLHRLLAHPMLATMAPSSATARYLQGRTAALGGLLEQARRAVSSCACESDDDIESVRSLTTQSVKVMREVERAVLCCLAAAEELGADDPSLHALALAVPITGLGPRGSAPDEVELTPDVFWGSVQPALVAAGAALTHRECSLTCQAERPLDAEPTVQRLTVTVDAHECCRVALVLCEEVF